MRGLYKLDITLTPYPPEVDGQPAPFGDVVEISRGTKWAYLYAGRSPHPELEVMGATLIGNTWKACAKAMTATDRGRVFEAEWEEDEAVLDENSQPTAEVRKVMRRGKLKDKPGGASAKPPKLRELIAPVGFGERELAWEQRELEREG
ncbi:MAG: hypothetical protein WC718_04310 [Phycisphaerales bacterium]|jgi:hypothetical protein